MVSRNQHGTAHDNRNRTSHQNTQEQQSPGRRRDHSGSSEKRRPTTRDSAPESLQSYLDEKTNPDCLETSYYHSNLQKRRSTRMQKLPWHKPSVNHGQSVYENNQLKNSTTPRRSFQRRTSWLSSRTWMHRSNIRAQANTGRKNTMRTKNHPSVRGFLSRFRQCAPSSAMGSDERRGIPS